MRDIPGRRRLGFGKELLLALLPTLTVLLVLGMIEVLSRQRLDESNLMLFCVAVGITAVLVLLQRAVLWTVRRLG